MNMSAAVEDFVSSMFDELCLSQRFVPYVEQAEAAGYPQLARLLRALVAGETAREALMRKGLPQHANETCDYYVCPHCGLVYDLELPDLCVVDQTPGVEFIVIK
jgi:rubrerythrin